MIDEKIWNAAYELTAMLARPVDFDNIYGIMCDSFKDDEDEDLSLEECLYISACCLTGYITGYWPADNIEDDDPHFTEFCEQICRYFEATFDVVIL